MSLFFFLSKTENLCIAIPIKTIIPRLPKTKTDQYIVNDVTYTLDATNHDEKWISNRNDFTVGNGLYKFVASADKSYDEARDIFSTANPWVIHNEILGWYHNAEKGFLHIYVSDGYLVWSYNNDNSDKHLNYSSVWEDGTKAYKSGTITFLFEYISEHEKTIYLHSSVVTDVYVYAFAAPFDKAFEDLN